MTTDGIGICRKRGMQEEPYADNLFSFFIQYVDALDEIGPRSYIPTRRKDRLACV